jgi:hypothetical protein
MNKKGEAVLISRTTNEDDELFDGGDINTALQVPRDEMQCEIPNQL